MAEKQTGKTVSTDQEKLQQWQERLKKSDNEWSQEVTKMDKREALYGGSNALEQMTKRDKSGETTPHVRNIIFELIEAQVSSGIPMPKVCAMDREYEKHANIIEHWIRSELDRQQTEERNDMAERIVPIQGGVVFHVEWDNSRRTWKTIGEQNTTLIHPKQLAPQPGVYTNFEDMDWVILKYPTTKGFILRKYGVDVAQEQESEPEIRAQNGTQSDSEDNLTLYIGYARNQDGGIDKYAWVNDTQIEDITNYQARRMPVCTKCGRVQPNQGQILSNLDKTGGQVEDPERQILEQAAGRQMANQLADQLMNPGMQQDGEGIGLTLTAGAEPELPRYDGGACPWCGNSEWTSQEMEWEEVIVPIETQMGNVIPGSRLDMDETGQAVEVPTRIPYYRPDVFPLVLQKSVSRFGSLLGNSDVDVIETQQNTINRMHKKIIDRLLKAGTRITLPSKARLKLDSEDNTIWNLDSPADKNMIGVYNFSGNLQYEMAYLNQVYEEARQVLGITDSFQGRRDPTATSGKAKEYAAAMSAGRLESKRIMKNAAYAKLFELMFKFQLAYADEPRVIAYKDQKGEMQYEEFNRYDFLVRDALGEWHWNDRFTFSVDTSAPLAANREAMWQETRANLQGGAFGDPTDLRTLTLIWGKMELLHYPGAGQTRKELEQRLEEQNNQTQIVPQEGAEPGQEEVLPQEIAAQMMQQGAAQPEGQRMQTAQPMVR